MKFFSSYSDEISWELLKLSLFTKDPIICLLLSLFKDVLILLKNEELSESSFSSCSSLLIGIGFPIVNSIILSQDYIKAFSR